MKLHIKNCFSCGYDTKKREKYSNRYAKRDRYFNHLILYEIILVIG
jgi:ribosomal protein L37E